MDEEGVTRGIISLYSIPHAIYGVPQADQWSTPYADMLDQIGEHGLAMQERTQACRQRREAMGLSAYDSRRWITA